MLCPTFPPQVTDWFTNWRSRHWKHIVKCIGASLDMKNAQDGGVLSGEDDQVELTE